MAKLTKLKPKVTTINMNRRTAPIAVRLTGNTGIKARARILRRDDYLCQTCLRANRVSVAVEVDHITPLHLGGGNNDENQEGICFQCHEAKTGRESRERG